jgi:carbonic anhydrase
MNRRLRVTRLILGLALFTTFSVAKPGLAQEKPAAKAHWSYSGPDGPSHWGDLEPDFATCKTGEHQAPIDIKDAKSDSTLPPIQFDYKPSPLKIINNGHTIQINLKSGGSITIGGAQYQLVQFYFHKPSEEAINGKHFDMSVHLVHQDAGGKLAVVAVLLKSGKENQFIQSLWNNLPAEEGKEYAPGNVTVNVASLLPVDRNYYTFDGSLTTPPCSEGVEWFVLKTPVELSAAQIAAFAKLYQMNARPIQPLNGREVRESEFKTSQ